MYKPTYDVNLLSGFFSQCNNRTQKACPVLALKSSPSPVSKKLKFWVDKEYKNILFPHETGRITGAMALMVLQ